MDTKDFIGGLVWLVAGTAIMVGSLLSLDVGTANEPGPGLLPLIAGIVVTLLALVILLKAILVTAKREWKVRDSWKGFKGKKLFYAAGSLLIYAAMLERVGFLLMTLLLLLFLFRKIEPQTWKVTIALSIVASMGSYLVFDRLLQAQLPKGFLGF